MRTVKGDLVKMAHNNEFNVIVHGCNCFNVMGSGIAKQIAHTFPEAREVDNITVKGDSSKLGKASIAMSSGAYGNPVMIVNAYTQYTTARTKGEVVVDYDAISLVFGSTISNIARMSPDIKIGIPMIGAGLAGGDWNRIHGIIEHHLRDITNPDIITLVEYNGE